VTCRQCGTEIADKALICYRCGRSTTDERAQAGRGAAGARRPVWPAALALAVLVLAGLFMATAAAGRVPNWLRWSVVGLAAVALAGRLVRRRMTR